MPGIKDKFQLTPNQKRWVLWGASFLALATVVFVFNQGQPSADESQQESAQEAIQGVIQGNDTRELSIGALNERLKRQQQAKRQLEDKVSDLSSSLQKLQQRQEKISDLEARNTELTDQIEQLRTEIQRRQAGSGDSGTSTHTSAAAASAPSPDSSSDSDGRPRVDTRQAFEREPARPAPSDGSGEGQGRTATPEIRTIAASVTAADQEDAGPQRTIRNYLQTGSIVSGLLLSGLDAPTNAGAQQNTVPVTMRVKKNAVLPNRHRSDFRECFVLLEGYGELSSERVHLRANTLSCVRDNDTVLEIPMRAYAVGEDGKTGLRGRLVSKQGAVIARSMVSGFASGMAEAFEQTPVPTIQTGSDVGGRQQFQTPNVEASAESGAFSGASQALNQVAEFYLNMAEQMFPVLEVNPGRRVDLVLTSGMDLRTGDDTEDDSSTESG